MNQGPPKKQAKKVAKNKVIDFPKKDEETKDKEFEKVLTNEQEPNFETDGVASTEDDLKKITKSAERLVQLYQALAEEEEFMTKIGKEIQQIEEGTLPEIMKKCGMKEFKLTNGLIVEIKDVVRAGLPAAGTIDKASGVEKEALVERLHAGLTYVKEHGAEDIIKSEVLVQFEKGQNKKKEAFYQAALKKGLRALSIENIHPQTLLAWIKEKLKAGEDLPFDTFGIFQGEKAVVKLPTTKKSKA